MVIVSLGFVGIIIGALLAAAGYAYKLKLQNKNAKNNFYYVEQAMQEIYAGVGANTIEEMKAAYSYTVENMVRFDPMLGTYVTLDDDVANKMFKKKFMENIQNSEYFAQGDEALAAALESYISNETVDLDNEKINLQVTTNAEGETTITIKNVTLTRIQEYDQSAGAGTYVQTISTDIVISEPDFQVSFNNIMSDYSEIFEYALIGDMGVQIVDNTDLEINGNIYASADYYNKAYNLNPKDVPDVEEKIPDTYKLEEKVTNPDGTVTTSTLYEYSIAPVTSKNPSIVEGSAIAAVNPAINGYANKVLSSTNGYLFYDGENTYSMNSGLYMSNSNVTIMADRVIVPGTVAVMDSSDFIVFGSAGVVSEVWADNIVLGGSSLVEKKTTNGSDTFTYKGSQAIFGGNLYVRDDTEINAKGAKFTLHGSYYGYGNGTSKDSRTFVPTVDTTNFQVPYTVIGADGKETVLYENRGHYNTSSIVVNGEASTLDLSQTKKVFVAGRAYIELSKDVQGATPSEDKYEETFTYVPTNTTTVDGKTETEFIRDYKTAESISIKSNQMMYNITSLGTTSEVQFTSATEPTLKCNVISLKGKPNAQMLFDEFFPHEIFGYNVPYVSAKVDGKSVYLIDFDSAYAILQVAANDPKDYFDDNVDGRLDAYMLLQKYETVNAYAQAFALAYVDHIENNDETELRDIITYDEFDQGTVIMPSNEGLQTNDPNLSYVYSSGAISTREGTTFSMVTANSQTDLDKLLSFNSNYDNYKYVPTDNVNNEAVTAFTLSEDLEAEYNYLKWNLNHYDTGNKEMEFVKNLVMKMGEDYITPINKYLVMAKVTETINTTTASGYKVYISDDDVVVSDGDNDSITGIVITKGDVSFSPKVKHFEGMIVAGGKIYISSELMSLTASPNVCRGIIRDCLALGDATAIKILNVFKEYENYKVEEEGEGGEGGSSNVEVEEIISIDSIDYSQVVSMTNWMKNVGGDYDDTHTP